MTSPAYQRVLETHWNHLSEQPPVTGSFWQHPETWAASAYLAGSAVILVAHSFRLRLEGLEEWSGIEVRRATDVERAWSVALW